MNAGKKMARFALLIFAALALGGCEGQGFIFGNMFFMGITCAMLWSTINLKNGD